MNILFCITPFRPQLGGLETHVAEMSKRLVARGHRVTVLSIHKTAPIHEVWEGVAVHRVRPVITLAGIVALPHPLQWMRAVRLIASEWAGERGIVWTHTRFFTSSWLGASVARSLRSRHVHTEHGSDFVQHTSTVVRVGSRILDELFGKPVLKNADMVLCVSDAVRDFIYRWTGRRAITTYNGVDSLFWSEEHQSSLPDELAQWLGDRVPTLFMGRLIAAKGADDAITAFASLPSEYHQKTALVIAGSGPNESRLAARIQNEGLQNGVYMAGRLQPEVIRALLARGSYVNPSYSAEGLQTTLVEAAFMNSWIITSDTPGTDEVVRTNAVGSIVARQKPDELTQAIMSWVDQGMKRSNGRAEVESILSWDAIVDQTEKALRATCHTKRVVMIRSNPVLPDPRVEKEARVVAQVAQVVVLAWDRTSKAPRDEQTFFGRILRVRVPAGYGGLHILLGLVRFNLWVGWHLLWGRYDIVHAADLDTGFVARIVTALRRKPLVYDMYDMYAEAASALLPEPLLKVAWKLEAWVVAGAKATIIVDDARRKQIAGMTPKDLVVVYNAPEDLSVAPKKEKGTGTLEVFYAGVLDFCRGFEYLIEAITAVPGTHLTIAGFGVHEERIAQMCTENPNTTFLGRIPYAEVLRRSRESDVLFALYDPAVKNHQYSSPNKLFEAMMLGMPVIVSNGTGMSDIVERVGNGVVVPYGDAAALTEAISLLHNGQQRHEMGLKGRGAYDESYGWPVMEKRLLDLYHSLF